MMTATSGSTERYCLMAWISSSWMLTRGPEEELLKMTTESKKYTYSRSHPREMCIEEKKKKEPPVDPEISVFREKSGFDQNTKMKGTLRV